MRPMSTWKDNLRSIASGWDLLWGGAYGAIVGLGVNFAMGAVHSEEVWLARGCFLLSTLQLVAWAIWRIVTAPRTTLTKSINGALLIIAIAVFVGEWRYVNYRYRYFLAQSESKDASLNFVYVFPGVFVIDDESWLFVVNHYGHDPIFNIEIMFEDEDLRDAVRSQSIPFTDPSVVVHVPESDPLGGVMAKKFRWKPYSQTISHFEMRISTRNGRFLEALSIAWLRDRKFAYAMKMTNALTSDVLVDCVDRDYPNRDTAKSPCFPHFVSHNPSLSP